MINQTYKRFMLIRRYEGMISWAYEGLSVIQNQSDLKPDPDSYLPEDPNIEEFHHLTYEEIRLHPECWYELTPIEN
jgi:hypothetical protein